MGRQRKIGAMLSYGNIIAKNLVTFMYTPFLLRFVGQANYGLFQMTNSVMTGLSLLSMGFSSAYVKFYITYKVEDDYESIKKLNALYLLLFIVISTLALIIGSILVLNTDHLFGRALTSGQLILTRYLMIIMVIDVAITFISSVFDSNITVNEQFVFQQTRQLMQTFLVPMICVPLVFSGVGVLSIEITQVSITTLFLLLNINYCLKKLKMKFNFHNLPINLFKELGAFSFFIFLNQIVDLVNNNAPNFLLGMFKGAETVATFAVAMQVKNMFTMLSTSLSNIFIPQINELVNSGKSKDVLTGLMIKVGRIQMSILFFVLGGFIVVGKYFINVWAGSKNAEAYILIIIMVLPAIIPLSQNVGVEIQRAMNKHVFRSVVYTLFALVNIIFTSVGAMKFGLIGASSGFIISVLCSNGIAMNWYYQKKMGLNMKKYWLNTIGVTIPFVVSTALLLLLEIYIKIASLKMFLAFGIVYVLIYSIMHLRLIATDYEKNLIFDLFKK